MTKLEEKGLMMTVMLRTLLALLLIPVAGGVLAKSPRISPEDADGRRLYLIELADRLVHIFSSARDLVHGLDDISYQIQSGYSG